MPELPLNLVNNIQYFTGRTWLLPRLVDWLEKPDSQILLLTGLPGTGKSMIAAWLGGLGPIPTDITAQSQLQYVRNLTGAVYFCQSGSDSGDARVFAQEIAKQLTQQVKGFREASVATLQDSAQFTAHQVIGTISSGGRATAFELQINNLGDEVGQQSFNRILTEPLKILYESGYAEPLLIVVDALDEFTEYSETLVKFLSKWTNLPRPVRFLITCRSDQEVLKYFQSTTRIDIINDIPSNIDDVYLYVHECLNSIDEKSRDKLTERISVAANGNFLYAHYVIKDLLSKPEDGTNLEESELPVGLSGIYQGFLNRMIGDKWFTVFKPLLGLIAISQGEGLNRTHLQSAIHSKFIEGEQIEQALRICSQYLVGSLPNGPFRFFHKSFVDFLLEDETNIYYRIDQDFQYQLHNQLLNGLLTLYKISQWADLPQDETYLGNNLVYHLEQVKCYEEIHKLFCNEKWVIQRAKINLGGLLNDFERAQRITSGDITTLIRYGLFREIIYKRYAHIPVEGLGRALDTGMVRTDFLMLSIRNMSGNPESKLQAYLNVVQTIDLDAQRQNGNEVLEYARQINDPTERCRLTLKLLVYLPNSLKLDAYPVIWQAIFELQDKQVRIEQFSILWDFLNPAQYIQLRNDALRIEYIRQRIRVVDQVAGLLPHDLRDETWNALLMSICAPRIEKQDQHDIRSQLYALADLARRIPRTIEAEFGRLAGDIIARSLLEIKHWEDDNYFRFLEDVLEILMLYVPSTKMVEVWKRARAEPDKDNVQYNIATVAFVPQFPDKLIPELHDELKLITSPYAQSKVMMVLALRDKRLSTEQQEAKFLQAWHIFETSSPSESQRDTLVIQLPEKIAQVLWNSTILKLNDPSKYGGYERISSSLHGLAHRVPVQNIRPICLVLRDVNLKPHPRIEDRAKLIGVLVNRLSFEECEELWQEFFTSSLHRRQNSDTGFELVVELFEYLPENLKQNYWATLLSTIYSISDVRTRGISLARTLHYVSAGEKITLWLDTWEIVVKSGYGIDMVVKELPAIHAHMSPKQIAKLEAIQWNISVIDMCDNEAQIGLTLLLSHSSRQLILDIWNEINQRADRVCIHKETLSLAVYPFLSHEHRNDIELGYRYLGKIAGDYQYCLRELIRRWPIQIIIELLEKMCQIEGNNEHSYSQWARFLVSCLPLKDDFAMHIEYAQRIWKAAMQNITPKFWNDWPDICAELINHLPDKIIPDVWEDIKTIKTDYVRKQMERAIMPFLPNELILSLVDPKEKLFYADEDITRNLPDDIFTCDLLKYLRSVRPLIKHRYSFAEMSFTDFVEYVIYSLILSLNLPATIARKKLIEILQTGEVSRELAVSRYLLQRAGGKSLRASTSKAYRDSITWWSQAINQALKSDHR